MSQQPPNLRLTQRDFLKPPLVWAVLATALLQTGVCLTDASSWRVRETSYRIESDSDAYLSCDTAATTPTARVPATAAAQHKSSCATIDTLAVPLKERQAARHRLQADLRELALERLGRAIGVGMTIASPVLLGIFFWSLRRDRTIRTWRGPELFVFYFAGVVLFALVNAITVLWGRFNSGQEILFSAPLAVAWFAITVKWLVGWMTRSRGSHAAS